MRGTRGASSNFIYGGRSFNSRNLHLALVPRRKGPFSLGVRVPCVNFSLCSDRNGGMRGRLRITRSGMSRCHCRFMNSSGGSHFALRLSSGGLICVYILHRRSTRLIIHSRHRHLTMMSRVPSRKGLDRLVVGTRSTLVGGGGCH